MGHSFRQWFKRWQSVLVIAPSVAGLMIVGSQLGFFRLLEWVLWDQLFRVRPFEGVDPYLVVVTIDEADITALQQWPPSDQVIVQLLNQIKAQNPKAIGLDIYRDFPVEPGHAALVHLYETTPNLVGIEKMAGEPVPPPPALAALGQVGASDLISDSDGKFRRGLVLVGRPSDGVMREGLGAKLALMALAADGIELGVIDPERNIYSLGQARFDPLTGQEGVYGAGETGGYQILINYRGELDDFQHISLREVLAGEIPPGFMTDRIVMIGAIAPSLNDLRPTVYNSTLLRSTELMPGVVIHANLTSQILQSALEGRPMLRASHKMWNQLLVVVWSFYSAILGTCYVQNSRLTWFSALVAAIAIPTSAYLAFLWGWLIPIFTPLLAVMSAGSISVRVTLWTQLKLSYRELSHQHQLLQEAHLQLHKTNESYGRFVPFEYLEFLEKDNILEVELGDHVTKAMAIMFSDIRFFTTLSEDMTPQQTFDFVNTYLQTVTPAICTYQGLVVKFLGDGIMAVFPQGANDAVAAGIAQQVKIRDYNKHQIKTQQIPIRVGIGIHIGRIMVGIIGEASRVQVDTLSDNVNLAARLEGLTKFYGVSLLISESVLQALHQPEQYQIRFLDQAIVKGKNEPISVYEVLDAEPQKIRDLKQATQTEFDQGLQAYRHQAFGAAIVHFNQVLKVNPLDKTARLYLERIEILQQQEIPKNWDGVWRFTQK